MARQTTASAAAPTGGGRTTGHVISKDGTLIAYERSGAGPPLILVLGALGAKDSAFARPYADELAKDFTVYNYDRRGRGDSKDTPPYSVQKEIDDLAALAKAAGGRPCVFGLSSGGALALHAAAAGVPIEKLVAYEPPYMLPDAKAPPAPDFEAHLQRLAREDKRSEAVTYFMKTVGVPGFAVAIMRLFPFWKQMKAVAHTLPYDAAIMAGFSVPAKTFGTIRVPTLLASGTKSPENLQRSAAAIATIVPGAEFRAVPKQNHGVRPKAIAPVLRDFLRPDSGGNGARGAKHKGLVTAPAGTRSR